MRKTMPFVSWVHGKTDVRKENFTNDSVEIVFEATPELADHVRRKVEELNGRFETNPKTM